MAARRPTVARGMVIAAVLLGTILCQSAAAQELPRGDLLASVVRQPWIRFEIIYGRVVLKAMRPVQMPPRFGPGTRRELLTIRVTGADSAMDYELTTPEEQISIRFSSADRVEIRRVPKGDAKSPSVEFRQAGTAPVSLKIGPPNPREYRAASLWHLLLEEPAECRKSLVPLLGLLQPKWDLLKTGDEVRAILLRMADGGRLPDQRRWAEWVAQLGDSQFAKREAADRQLREAGRGVVAYLQQLDPGRLDAEQQYRVHRIIQALTVASGEDAPEQIASWLFSDPAVWLAMLSSETESTRKTASRQLGALVGKPIDFDPAADAPTRQKQIEALRPKFPGK
jgi:hypothetical protein